MAIQADEMLRILLEHPAQIESETNRFYALVLKEQDLQRQMGRYEQDVYQQVHSEETPDGKKSYSNEQLRTAEVTRRLITDSTFKALREEESSIFKAKHDCQAKIDRYKREHRGCIAAVSILNSKTEDKE